MWKRDLLRPTLYQCVTKCSVALAAILLWDRFVNQNGARSAVRDGGFIAGMVLLAAAWFSYLRLDGVTIHHFLEERKKKPKTRHWMKDMVDFADEGITPWEELTDQERGMCGLCSSVISALIFLIPALVATVAAIFHPSA